MKLFQKNTVVDIEVIEDPTKGFTMTHEDDKDKVFALVVSSTPIAGLRAYYVAGQHLELPFGVYDTVGELFFAMKDKGWTIYNSNGNPLTFK